MHLPIPSLTFQSIGGFTLPISGGFTLRKFGGAKLLITRKFERVWKSLEKGKDIPTEDEDENEDEDERGGAYRS